MTASSTFGYARTADGVYIGYRVDGDGAIDSSPNPTGRATSTWNGWTHLGGLYRVATDPPFRWSESGSSM
jgi:hypothetical protein